MCESDARRVIADEDKRLEAAYATSILMRGVAIGGGGVGGLVGGTVEGPIRLLESGVQAFELLCLTTRGETVSLPQMKHRKRAQHRELDGVVFSTSAAWKQEEMHGRISGDADWKLSRGEIKSSEISFTSTSTSTAFEGSACEVSNGGDGGLTIANLKARVFYPPAWLCHGIVLSSSITRRQLIDLEVCMRDLPIAVDEAMELTDCR